MTLRLMLFSSSKVAGTDFLEAYLDVLADLYRDVDEVVFIPFARPGGTTHDAYLEKARPPFARLGKTLLGAHGPNGIELIHDAGAVFVGGGNTFVLLKALYERNMVTALQAAVSRGTIYSGASAGTNVAGLTIGTTNDMPIIYPPSLDALGLVPFNINPHYLDPSPASTHQGETRDMRIQEFHHQNKQPVVALREGAWLELQFGHLVMGGQTGGKLFTAGGDPVNLRADSNLDHLLQKP